MEIASNVVIGIAQEVISEVQVTDLVWKSKKAICMGLNSAPATAYQLLWSQLMRVRGKWQNPAAALLTLHPPLNVDGLTQESMHGPWAFSIIQ